jgi:uncharacterized protein (DUF302 family)
MMDGFAFTMESKRSFGEVVANIEKNVPLHQFRVLAVHDVQATLAEKGITRPPLKIIEICNSKFAHEALGKEPEVALFMPCKFAVYGEEGKTVVKLGRPSMISMMMPQAGLNELAASVEATMMGIMKESI